MNDNILKVSFGGNREITANPLWQYDYGQTLVIRGLDLPALYEVHFGQSKTGNAVTAHKTETREALQTLFDNINKGQQKQLVKREEIKKLFDRYGVQY